MKNTVPGLIEGSKGAARDVSRTIAVHLLVACALATGFAAHAESEDHVSSSNRTRSVINAFEVMCALELPKFDAIAAKATAMRMLVQVDKNFPGAGGTKVRQKAWGGELTTGPFLLMLDEMSGAEGTATDCAVVAEVPDVDALRMETVSTMKLAVSTNPELGADGSRSYLWEGVFGLGTTLIFRDFKPAGKQGAMLKLQSMQRQ